MNEDRAAAVAALLAEGGLVVAPPGHRHVRAGWVGFDCPHCSPASGRWRAGLSVGGRGPGAVVCWSCGPLRPAGVALRAAGASGAAVGAVYALLGSGAALKAPAQRGGAYLPPPAAAMGPRHREYLLSRGFDPDEIARLWQVAGIGPDGGRWAWRLLLPIPRGGRPASWTTRAIGPRAVPRYLAAPPDREVVPCDQLLYGLDHVADAAVVVEGPADAWAIGPGAVATLGAAVTDARLAAIASIPRRCILFDNEPEAQRRARRLAETLAAADGETVLLTIDADDPAAAMLQAPEELAAVRREAFGGQ